MGGDLKHERDASGHWLANLCAPTLSMRAFLAANEELQRRQARRMGMNASDMQALRHLDLVGPLGPTELARLLGLRSASVTVLLDRLDSAGLIERVRDDHDRRRVTVRALPHAADVLLDTWAPVIRALDDVGRGLTPAQRKAVCAFFEQITAVVEHALTDPGATDSTTRTTSPSSPRRVATPPSSAPGRRRPSGSTTS